MFSANGVVTVDKTCLNADGIRYVKKLKKKYWYKYFIVRCNMLIEVSKSTKLLLFTCTINTYRYKCYQVEGS